MARKRFPNAKQLARAFDEYMDEYGFSCDHPGVLRFSFDDLIPRLPAALNEMQLPPWQCHYLSLPDGSSYATGFKRAARFYEVANAEDTILEILDQATTSGSWNEAATEIAQIAKRRLFEHRFYVLSSGTHRALFSNMGDGRPDNLTFCTFRSSYLVDLGAEELGFGADSECYSWALIVKGSSEKKLLEALRASFCIATT